MNPFRHKFFAVLIATFALVLAAVLYFALQKPPEIPSVPRRFVQATIVEPIQEKIEKSLPMGPFPHFGPFKMDEEEGSEIKDLKTATPVKQEWKENAIEAVPVPKGGGKVVVIIDDMGMDHHRSAQVIDMRYPLTLAFLPYTSNLKTQTSRARSNGHELMIHVPMQPKSNSIDPGPDVMTVDMDEAQLKAALEKEFNSFEGYVGINNHMGSRFTEDKTRMGWVMEELKKRGLLFVDSVTIGDTVGASTAKEYGLPYARRDVFLDDDPSMEAVQKSLRHLEALAYKNGVAIAIGHPKDNTIAALKEWLPTLQDKNLTLVPVSQVVHLH